MTYSSYMCKENKMPVTLMKRSYMTLTLNYIIVNIQMFRLKEIRSHMIETISVMPSLTLGPGPESRTCLRYYHIYKCVKLC